jgi:hypothetical protein
MVDCLLRAAKVNHVCARFSNPDCVYRSTSLDGESFSAMLLCHGSGHSERNY